MLLKKINKFKKIICVISAVIIAVFSCCISASAVTVSPYDVDNPIRLSIGQPPAGDHSGYIEVLTKNSSGDYGFRVLYWDICPDEASDSSTFPVCMNIKITSKSVSFMIPDNAQDLTFSSLCAFSSNGSYFYRLLNFNNDYTYTYSTDNSIVGFHIYGNYNLLSNSVTDGEKFYVTYSGDSVIFTMLRNMFSVLNQLSKKLDLSVVSDSSNQIIANDNKNMDDLKNGWSDSTNMDQTVTNDFNDSQDALVNNTESGRNAAVDAFSNLGNDFIFRCLKSSTSIFTKFLEIDWLYSLVQFSLSLGMFSFLIGAVSMVVGKVSSERKAEERKNNPRVYTYNHYHYSGKKSDSNNSK